MFMFSRFKSFSISCDYFSLSGKFYSVAYREICLYLVTNLTDTFIAYKMSNHLDDPLLCCSVKLNFLDAKNSITRSVNNAKSVIQLGRNEFRDIILKLECGKFGFSFGIKDMTLHTKFVKEGKATITLKEPKVQIMISNCPTGKLNVFLKTMFAKVEKLKETKPVGLKERLLSVKTSSFEEISPLTAVDVNILSSRLNVKKANIPETPKSQKRKRDCLGQEITPNRKVIAVPRPLVPRLLTDEQKYVMNAVMAGRNVFFTGSAGTGKSFLLKRILGALAPDSTYATASTGVAACQIGGITLHSFAGMGSGSAPIKQCIDLVEKKGKSVSWRQCQHLIVDEISMVDGDFFQKLEVIARHVKKNDKPFGGIQLILTGDFLQLPPVCKKDEKRKFCFQSAAWSKCIDTNIELSKVKRQSDQDFINILQEVRIGRASKETLEKLKKTAKQELNRDGILATKLSTHKDDVEIINQSHLQKLNASKETLEKLKKTAKQELNRDGILATKLSTHKDDVEIINQSHLQKLNGEMQVFFANDNNPGLFEFMNKHCPVSDKLELKIGAQVMLTKNLDVQRGLVNGARGVVVGFEGKKEKLPIVKFVCGAKEIINYEKWSIRAHSGVILTRRMLPLKLAWAMSIHKSQGMTLDCVEVSLSRVFECGQAYVALSRARSMDGLKVLDIESSSIRADPLVLKFYNQLQHSSILHYRMENDL